MGKSEGEGNAVFLAEDPASIRKKVMRAVTDAGPTEMNQTKPEPIQNLFDLMAVVTADTDYVNNVIEMGAEKARASGVPTVRGVREIIGFRKIY